MSYNKHDTLEQIRKKHIIMVLDSTAWDLAKASKLLELPVEDLRREIKKIGLEANEKQK